MPIHRVALIFDGVQRPETTGVYCHRALGALVQVEHFQPGELDRVPRTGFDLDLNIDDGLRYHLPPDLHPSAWWAIDTHMDLAWCLEKAWGFDQVFAAQQDGAEQLRRGGIRSTAWLPLGCDPEIHARHDVVKQFDVAFVGNVFPGPRADLLELVRRRYRSNFIGRCYFEDMARTYSAARTVFNRSIKNDVNMRVFEAVACGSLLVTNDLAANGQAELFQDGVHLATYREPEDLLDKLALYLDRETLLEKIAAAGRALALEEHTYVHRMERLLRETESRLQELVSFNSPGAGDIPIAAVRDGHSNSPERGGNRLAAVRGALKNSPGRGGDRLAAVQGALKNSPERGGDRLAAVQGALKKSPGRGDIVEPGVSTPGQTPKPSFLPCPSPGGAAPASADPHAMSPHPGLVRGDQLSRHAGYHGSRRHSQGSRPGLYDVAPSGAHTAHAVIPRAHALGSMMSPPPGLTMPPSAGLATPPQPGPVAAPDPFYFGHARPEVMALIPETARTVLDIGCGAGRLGEALKARQQTEVVGIELNEAAAAAARLRLDRVFTGDVERLDLPLPPEKFDAIVCADILEHLRDPDRMLRQALAWLAPDGRLIASISNVRHHSVIRSLLAGNWTYEPAGLLDRDHLRFFTRREIEKLFFRAGYAIDEMRTVVGPGDHEAVRNLRGTVQLGRLAVSGLSERDAAEYYTYQYLIRARPGRVPDHGLTSIVIVTHNQLEYTRQCLDSVKSLTDEPCELIFVDNGSRDGTVEYLKSAFPDARLIVNDGNRGFPAAVNQGIAEATGSQVLLLNNDVIVTTGWLCRLLEALYSDPAIGLVGPCSNFVSGPQQIEARYDSLAELDGFAWDWGGAHSGQRFEVNRLVGFCLLIRRAVVESIGPFDERFGPGCFEDDDYCLRAIQAGYRAVIAADAFVHHFGGRSFVGSGIDFPALMRDNERRFLEKWAWSGVGPFQDVDRGRIPPHPPIRRPLPTWGLAEQTRGPSTASSSPARGEDARRPGEGAAVAPGAAEKPSPPHTHLAGIPELSPASFALGASHTGGLIVRRRLAKPRLSLCMIVRDSARTLPACLESIRPWVDEMVIVDTGSSDETPRIVESFGGRLFHFPWCDSFSIARNESLRHAQGDWLFWMDSDDSIPPECGRNLRRLIDREVPPELLGYIMQVHCPDGGEDGGLAFDVTIVDHVKLFRNRPDLRFDGRIHEQVLPAIRAAGGEAAWTDIYVVHSGSDQSPAAQEKKRLRDLRLLDLEIAERPEHPFTLFNLGMTYTHGSRFTEAVDSLRRGIVRSGPDEPHVRKAFALLIFSLMQVGRMDEAAHECRRGRAMFPRDTELRFWEGVLLHELGRLHEARQAYLDVLRNGDGDERHFASTARALTGFKARQNLAVVAADLGDLAEAERQWREVVREVPQYRPGWRGLAETLLQGGRFAEALALATELMGHAALRVEGLLIKSRAAVRLERYADARDALDRAIDERPDDLETLHRRCQFLFERGEPAEAEVALQALIARDPRDAKAHHNLGQLFMRTGRHDEAVLAYRQSLRYRPNSAQTYLCLGYALRDSGRPDEAVAAWEHVLWLVPGEPTARQELASMERAPAGAQR